MRFDYDSDSGSPESDGDILSRLLVTLRQPDAVGTLTTPTRIDRPEFERRVRAWRMESGRLHPHDCCPPRKKRRIEYAISLEYGPLTNRLHGHVVVWKAAALPLEKLRIAWREVCAGRFKNGEPLLEPYSPGSSAVRYAMKKFHTDMDFVLFSPQLAKCILGSK